MSYSLYFSIIQSSRALLNFALYNTNSVKHAKIPSKPFHFLDFRIQKQDVQEGWKVKRMGFRGLSLGWAPSNFRTAWLALSQVLWWRLLFPPSTSDLDYEIQNKNVGGWKMFLHFLNYIIQNVVDHTIISRMG
jgi:hypothetical protein